LTRMRTGSVMNCCVICSTSLGSVALTSTTWIEGGGGAGSERCVSWERVGVVECIKQYSR
jgi:hypothetical protein